MPKARLPKQTSVNSAVHKLAVLGSPDSGKALLINRILGNSSQQGHSLYEKTICVDLKQNTNLHVMDTSDLDEYPAMKRVTIANADVFILLINVDDIKSFEEVNFLYDEIIMIKSSSSERVPLIVVGNQTEDASQRTANQEQIKNVMVSKWNRRYVEIFLSSDDGIDQVLAAIKEEMRDTAAEEGPSACSRAKRKTSLIAAVKSIF